MMENSKKAKKPFVSRYSRMDSSSEILDPERYEELVEEGFSDSYIAYDLNMNEEFLSSLKKDMDRE